MSLENASKNIIMLKNTCSSQFSTHEYSYHVQVICLTRFSDWYCVWLRVKISSLITLDLTTCPTRKHTPLAVDTKLKTSELSQWIQRFLSLSILQKLSFQKLMNPFQVINEQSIHDLSYPFIMVFLPLIFLIILFY